MDKNKVVLLSFPRSGLHLVMYTVQFLTGKGIVEGIDNTEEFIGMRGHSKGIAKLLSHVDTSDKIALRRHFSSRKKGYSRYPTRLMMILRDPVEAILSHFCSNKKAALSDLAEDDWFSKNQKFVEESSIDILTNVCSYEICKRSKCIIVYEDLVFNNTTAVIRKIGKFFRVPRDKVDLYLQDLDKYKEDCFQLLMRPANSNSPKFYASKLTDRNLEAMKSMVYNILGHPIIKKLYKTVWNK